MRIAIIAAALGLVVSSLSLDAGPTTRKAHKVTMVGMRFQPEVLTVAPGDTVEWVNQDIVAHTATSTAGGFDSKMVEPEKTWKLTVRKKGEFPYVCKYHPTMTGTLGVK